MKMMEKRGEKQPKEDKQIKRKISRKRGPQQPLHNQIRKPRDGADCGHRQVERQDGHQPDRPPAGSEREACRACRTARRGTYSPPGSRSCTTARGTPWRTSAAGLASRDPATTASVKSTDATAASTKSTRPTEE